MSIKRLYKGFLESQSCINFCTLSNRSFIHIPLPSLNSVFEINNEVEWTQETTYRTFPTYAQILQKCKETNIFMEKNYLYYKILCFTAIDWKKCFITSDILNFPLIFPMKIFVSLHFCNVWAYMRKVLYVVSWVHFLFRSHHSN